MQEWLGSTSREVSYKAVDYMMKQKQIVLNAFPSRQQPNPPALILCIGRFRMQFGLPYSYEILKKLETKRSVVKAEIHQFWYLEHNLDQCWQ